MNVSIIPTGSCCQNAERLETRFNRLLLDSHDIFEGLRTHRIYCQQNQNRTQAPCTVQPLRNTSGSDQIGSPTFSLAPSSPAAAVAAPENIREHMTDSDSSNYTPYNSDYALQSSSNTGNSPHNYISTARFCFPLVASTESSVGNQSDNLFNNSTPSSFVSSQQPTCTNSYSPESSNSVGRTFTSEVTITPNQLSDLNSHSCCDSSSPSFTNSAGKQPTFLNCNQPAASNDPVKSVISRILFELRNSGNPTLNPSQNNATCSLSTPPGSSNSNPSENSNSSGRTFVSAPPKHLIPEHFGNTDQLSSSSNYPPSSNLSSGQNTSYSCSPENSNSSNRTFVFPSPASSIAEGFGNSNSVSSPNNYPPSSNLTCGQSTSSNSYPSENSPNRTFVHPHAAGLIPENFRNSNSVSSSNNYPPSCNLTSGQSSFSNGNPPGNSNSSGSTFVPPPPIRLIPENYRNSNSASSSNSYPPRSNLTTGQYTSSNSYPTGNSNSSDRTFVPPTPSRLIPENVGNLNSASSPNSYPPSSNLTTGQYTSSNSYLPGNSNSSGSTFVPPPPIRLIPENYRNSNSASSPNSYPPSSNLTFGQSNFSNSCPPGNSYSSGRSFVPPLQPQAASTPHNFENSGSNCPFNNCSPSSEVSSEPTCSNSRRPNTSIYTSLLPQETFNAQNFRNPSPNSSTYPNVSNSSYGPSTISTPQTSMNQSSTYPNLCDNSNISYGYFVPPATSTPQCSSLYKPGTLDQLASSRLIDSTSLYGTCNGGIHVKCPHCGRTFCVKLCSITPSSFKKSGIPDGPSTGSSGSGRSFDPSIWSTSTTEPSHHNTVTFQTGGETPNSIPYDHYHTSAESPCGAVSNNRAYPIIDQKGKSELHGQGYKISETNGSNFIPLIYGKDESPRISFLTQSLYGTGNVKETKQYHIENCKTAHQNSKSAEVPIPPSESKDRNLEQKFYEDRLNVIKTNTQTFKITMQGTTQESKIPVQRKTKSAANLNRTEINDLNCNKNNTLVPCKAATLKRHLKSKRHHMFKKRSNTLMTIPEEYSTSNLTTSKHSTLKAEVKSRNILKTETGHCDKEHQISPEVAKSSNIDISKLTQHKSRENSAVVNPYELLGELLRKINQISSIYNIQSSENWKPMDMNCKRNTSAGLKCVENV